MVHFTDDDVEDMADRARSGDPDLASCGDVMAIIMLKGRFRTVLHKRRPRTPAEWHEAEPEILEASFKVFNLVFGRVPSWTETRG